MSLSYGVTREPVTAIAEIDHELQGVRRLWVDGKLIWSHTAGASAAMDDVAKRAIDDMIRRDEEAIRRTPATAAAPVPPASKPAETERAPTPKNIGLDHWTGGGLRGGLRGSSD
jgi:hypothetical protein